MAFIQVQCHPTYQDGKPNTDAETSSRVLNTDYIVSARAYGLSTTHVTLVDKMSFVVAIPLDEFHDMLTTADPA